MHKHMQKPFLMSKVNNIDPPKHTCVSTYGKSHTCFCTDAHTCAVVNTLTCVLMQTHSYFS